LGERNEEVQGEQDLAAAVFGDGLGLLDSFLGFLSQFVESEHRRTSGARSQESGVRIQNADLTFLFIPLIKG
jgi:hypothetical protein